MEDSDAWTIQMTLVAPPNSLNPYHGHVTAAEEGTEEQRLRVACSGYYWQTKELGFGPRSVLCNAMLDLWTRACLSLVTTATWFHLFHLVHGCFSTRSVIPGTLWEDWNSTCLRPQTAPILSHVTYNRRVTGNGDILQLTPVAKSL